MMKILNTLATPHITFTFKKSFSPLQPSIDQYQLPSNYKNILSPRFRKQSNSLVIYIYIKLVALN